MIIFQTAGSGGWAGSSLSALGRELLGEGPAATTFRSNGYIHRLNRTLQAEMRAVSAYSAGRDALHAKNGEEHGHAGKTLVRLIIANRGIPEDRTVLSLGLTRTWIGLCTRIPTKLFEKATAGTLLTLEAQLARRYRELLREAPARDVPELRDLLKKTERRRTGLLRGAVRKGAARR